MNFEKLPKRKAYEIALKKDGRIFNDCIFQYLDQSKWEDRFILLLRVARGSVLEIDNRVKSIHYAKDLEAQIDILCQDGTENKTKEVLGIIGVEETQEWVNKIEDLLGRWKVGGDNYLQMMLFSAPLYERDYPSSMVRRTNIGKLVDKAFYDINLYFEKEIHQHCQNLMDNFVMFIDQLQEKTTQHIMKNEELFLHKGDIDWRRIAKIRTDIEDIAWYFRQEHSTVGIDDWYSIPHTDAPRCFHADFIVDYALYRLCKLYEVQLIDYIPELKPLHQESWVCYPKLTKQEEIMFFNLDDIYRENLEFWENKYPYLK